MSNSNPIATPDLLIVNSSLGTDRLIITINPSNVATAQTRAIGTAYLLGNSKCHHIVANGYFLVISSNSTPANSTDTTANTPINALWSDGTYIYVKTGNTAVKRSALSTW